MAVGDELILGTLFKGKLDPTFIQAVNQLRTILQGLNAQFKTFSTEAAAVSQSTKGISSALESVSTQTGKAAQAVPGFTKQIASASSGYQRFMAALKVTAAYGVAATAMYKLVAGIKAGISEIVDYDQALKNLQAITGATNIQISAMGDTLLDVAKRTKFSTRELADGMVLLGQAGFTAEESMQAISATADLASGTLSDLASTADLVTTTIRSYNLSAIESTRVADVMANAVNKSKLTIDKLRTSFNYVAAAASQSGVSLEETAATMMTLANNGLRASTIGTGLRQVLARMVAPSRAIREEMERYGIELSDINPTVVGFQTAIENLSKILVNSKTKTVDMQKAFTLFGLRGAQAAAVIVKSYLSGQWQRALEMARRIGTSSEMASKQLEGLGAMAKNISDRAGVLAVRLGEAGVAGAMRGFLNIVKDTLGVLDDFITTGIGQAIVKFGLLVTSISAVILIMKGLQGVLGAISFTAMITNPMNIAILAAAAFVAILMQLRGELDKEVESLRKAAIAHMSMADSLELYIQTLESLHKSQKPEAIEEYKNQLLRLVTTHKELSHSIDLTKLSHEDLMKVMREEKMKENQVALSNYTEAVAKHTVALEKLKVIETDVSIMHGQFGADEAALAEGLSYSTKSMEEFINASSEGKRMFDEIRKSTEAYLEALAKMASQNAITVGKARELGNAFIDTNIKVKSASTELRAYFENLLSVIGKTFLEIKDKTQTYYSQTKSFYTDMYRDLDVLRKADLAATMRSVEQKVASFNKWAEENIKNEKERQLAVETIRQRELLEFMEAEQQKLKGEKLTASERMAVLKEFISEEDSTYAYRLKSLEDQLNAILKSEKTSYDDRKAAFNEYMGLVDVEEQSHLVRKEAMLQVEVHMREEINRQLLDETIKALKEQIELEDNAAKDKWRIWENEAEKRIDLKKYQTDQLDKMDELAVLKGEITEKEALQRKWEREIASLEAILKIRMDLVEKSKSLYEEDSQNYADALKAKVAAEQALAQAKLDYQIETEKMRIKEEEDANKAVEKIDNIQKVYVRVSNAIRDNPIKIDIDTKPAEAALESLIVKYNTAVATMMAQLAELQASGARNAYGWMRQLISSINDYQNRLDRIREYFKYNPFGFGSSTATNKATSSAVSSTPSTKTLDTMNLNLNVGGVTKTLQVVGTTASTRDTVLSLQNELNKLGLSYG